MSESTKNIKRSLDGIVVSDKGDKTIIVQVVRRYKHAKYSKFIQSSKKYHAHDEGNLSKIGDTVTIIESRSYSKTKTWELVSKS